MDRRQLLAGSLAAPLLAQTANPPSRQFFELRWFHLRNGGDAPRMLDLLEKQWVPAAKRAGMERLGFFQPAIGQGSPSVLMLTAFNSADDAVTASDRMMADPDFAVAYARANAPVPAFSRTESTLLRAFTGMPALAPSSPDGAASRIFELRTYESNSMASLAKKLEMFNGGEIGIFQRLGMAPVFFGEAIFGRNLPSLTYMLSYESLAAREQLWKSFIADPGFQRLRMQPGYSDAEIVSNINNSILSPTRFSAIR